MCVVFVVKVQQYNTTTKSFITRAWSAGGGESEARSALLLVFFKLDVSGLCFCKYAGKRFGWEERQRSDVFSVEWDVTRQSVSVVEHSSSAGNGSGDDGAESNPATGGVSAVTIGRGGGTRADSEGPAHGEAPSSSAWTIAVSECWQMGSEIRLGETGRGDDGDWVLQDCPRPRGHIEDKTR